MGRVLDVKFLPEEDILALVTQSGSIAIFSMCLSEVSYKIELLLTTKVLFLKEENL